jgi:hypothetical protein
MGKFWRVLKWKILLYVLHTHMAIWSTYFTAIWNVLFQFGMFCSYLVCFFRFGMFCPYLVCFDPIRYVFVPIWYIFFRFGELYE